MIDLQHAQQVDVNETTSTCVTSEGPYIIHKVEQTITLRSWNASYDQRALCECGHEYQRHFDVDEDMRPCWCKYCECGAFKPKSTTLTVEQAIKVIMKQSPCGHVAVDERIGDGTIWVRCEDCDRTLLRSRLPQSRSEAERFEQAIEVIREKLGV